MRYVIQSFILVVALSVVACGDGRSSSVKRVSGNRTQEQTHKMSFSRQNLSYQFKVNDCDTGKQTFSAEGEYCLALQNETRNHYCAQEERAKLFESRCQGSFQPFAESAQDPGIDEAKSVLEGRAEGSDPNATAGDSVNGEILTRSLRVGQMSMVNYKNPTGDEAQTIVICVPSVEAAKEKLAADVMGGVVMSAGTRMMMKNDKAATFSDGTNLKGSYILFECK